MSILQNLKIKKLYINETGKIINYDLSKDDFEQVIENLNEWLIDTFPKLSKSNQESLYQEVFIKMSTTGK